MKKQIAVMIALFAVVAAGCKKDKDNPLEGGENGKTKYISKITTTEDDVQTVYVANYDAQNRLVSYNAQNNSEKTTFTYGANGNLVKYEFESDENKDVFEVTYNGANVPVTGKHTTYSNLAVVAEEALTYTVANDVITEMQAKNPDNEIATYKMTYQNNNLSKVEVTVPDGKFTISATYGNKKSPFLGLNLKYLIAPVNLFAYFAKNELTGVATAFNNQTIVRDVTTYTYDNDGYPLTSSSTNPDAPAEPASISKFEYK
jgi:YD repeat-containing protein